MQVLRTRAELLAWRASVPADAPVAFVPTMGYLHEGHLSLLREGRRRADGGFLVLSIFVNPTQFGPKEDLDRYPRDEAGDLAKAESCGVDVAFCPTDRQVLYPNGTSTWVEVEGLDKHLCGAARPGHFRGVCTVVAKLWGLVRPSVGLFGEKDYQQLAILRRMHADLNLVGEVVGRPIVREPDGLAMSSRNTNLNSQARGEALVISRYLGGCKGASLRVRVIRRSYLEISPGCWRRVASIMCRSSMPRNCSRSMRSRGRRWSPSRPSSGACG